MQACSKCGSETEYKKGISKKGNSYEGYKCLDETCGNFDFVSKRRPQQKSVASDISMTALIAIARNMLEVMRKIEHNTRPKEEQEQEAIDWGEGLDDTELQT